jgi:hypothetical protein
MHINVTVVMVICMVYTIFITVHYFSSDYDRTTTIASKFDEREEIVLRIENAQKFSMIRSSSRQNRPSIVENERTNATTIAKVHDPEGEANLDNMTEFIAANSNVVRTKTKTGCATADCVCAGRLESACVPKLKTMDGKIRVRLAVLPLRHGDFVAQHL